MTYGSAPGPPSLLPLPQRGFFSSFVASQVHFPTSSAVGRDDIPSDAPHGYGYMSLREVRIFCGLLQLTVLSTHLPRTRSPPPLNPSFVHQSSDLFTLFVIPLPPVMSTTLHVPFTFPSHTRITPPYCAHL